MRTWSKKIRRYLKWAGLWLLMLLFIWSNSVSAAEKQTIYNSPYVTFSPDGKAWTTNAGEKDYTFYPYGTTVTTGISSALSGLKTGQHYYRYAREDTIPVGRWVVEYPHGHCIHNTDTTYFHGLSYQTMKCYEYYNSGWLAYCADCGDELSHIYIYMNRAAAQSIDYLEMRAGMDYYFLCPHCRNLEQGRPLGTHMCKEVSWNQYKVVYHENTDSLLEGYMFDSYHMYNNAVEYEGEAVTPVTHLTRNSFARIGYEFAGWNTRPDGSGVSYEDGAEILNLSAADWKNSDTWTASDRGVVDLYAQWRPSESTLYIDPNGGSYAGSRQVTAVKGAYGSTYQVRSELVEAPEGCTVTFETNGGEPVESIQSTQHFTEWRLSTPFLGRFDRGVYLFSVTDGGEDTLTADYEFDSVILPGTRKDGSSFGGWYYDSSFSQPAGGEGDIITPVQDVTLYAQWVELRLYAEDNYTDNGGKGAVDLSWTQQDTNNKSYLVYQSRNGVDWTKINAADDISNSHSVEESFEYMGGSREYTVPYTGIYTLTACGAQGGGYANFVGGAGGSVTARFWLRQGEVLTITVGGQNGFHDGGAATAYGNGGGSTAITSDQKGILLIAGGGGGASGNGNGGAGGSVASLVSQSSGETGMAGGGGGAEGGSAGAVIRHYHTGSSNRYGGCYIVSDYCNSTSFTHESQWVDSYNNSNYYDVENQVLVQDAYCPQCGNNACVGHDIYKHWYICNQCGETYYDNCPDGCTNLFGYTTGCGYASGQITSSYPAYGGSSYVNSDCAFYQEKEAGVNHGNGVAYIRSEMIGFMETLDIGGVTATDLAAPGEVSRNVELVPEEEKRVRVNWRAPKDYGTTYFHVVESFLIGSDSPLCRSNITRNTLVSGVVGYYYLIDEEPVTTVGMSESEFTAEPYAWIQFEGEEPDQKKYLHVAAVDLAGNLGETTHICVESGSGDVAWNLYTDQLEIESGENIYPAGEGAWYVRSDGITPFTLDYRAYIKGIASLSYQPNYVIFESVAEGVTARNILFVPSQFIESGPLRTEAKGLTYSQQGQSRLSVYPYSVAIRTDRNRELAVVQKFVLDADLSGMQIDILPIVGADKKGAVVYSDYSQDQENGITVIADGEAPVISGLEPLEYRELIDRRDGSLTLTVAAEDELSGVREFYVSIVNSDNAVEKIYHPDEDGSIRLEITKDEPVFSGDFSVTAIAIDNVGNVAEIAYGTTEFNLEAKIERILEPHDPIFKSGESGILTFSVWGYADRVEVEFPEEMTWLNPELNQTFVYTGRPAYVQMEQIQFMIPLDTPLNERYTVTVRAYKGDRKLEEHPSVSVVGVNGTVLDEFRTRLR